MNFLNQALFTPKNITRSGIHFFEISLPYFKVTNFINYNQFDYLIYAEIEQYHFNNIN